MARLIYSMNVSVDGFVESPELGLDWGVVDEELHRYFNEQERHHGAHLYGRRMYETMRYWETATQDPNLDDYMRDYAQIWNALPKIVVSTTLQSVEGNARLVRGDLPAEVQRLKREVDGDIVVGGTGLAGSLLSLGLIDDFQLFIHPVLLGSGKRMFPQMNPTSLHPVAHHHFTSGVVLLHYRLAAA